MRTPPATALNFSGCCDPSRRRLLYARHVFQQETALGPVRQDRIQIVALGGEERFDRGFARLPACPSAWSRRRPIEFLLYFTFGISPALHCRVFFHGRVP